MSMTVLITRPKRQAQHLAALLQSEGEQTIILPTLDIYPPHDLPSLKQTIKQLDQIDIVIFVSANAVHYASKHWPNTAPPTITTMAIGPGTARALTMKGLPVDWIPDSHHSEGLLSLPILQNVRSKKIAIFCGENTRPLLKETLIARGADVIEAVCYRRQCAKINAAEQLAVLQKKKIHVIVSTSPDSLTYLWQIFGTIAAKWLQAIPLLVISPAMVEQAASMGFESVLLASGASDQAVLARLKQFFQESV